MQTSYLLGIALMTILPSTAKSESPPCNRPDFPGEVWAAEVTSPKGNLATIYWVFERGAFHEYLHFANSGKTTQLGSGRYAKLADSYVIKAALPHERIVRRAEARPDSVVDSADVIEVFFDQASLQLPAGQRLTRLIAADQSLPWLGRAPSTAAAERTVIIEASCDCCWLCVRVHAFLGTGYLDGICCFFDGGCAGNFCGGGGDSGGGGSSLYW